MKKITLIGRTGVHSSAEMPVSQEILMGRDAKVCQLVYPSTERTISSVHCKLQVINEEVYLTDMNSTNGTFLENGTKLIPQSPVRIMNGQGFYLGNSNNAFVIKEQIITSPAAERVTPVQQNNVRAQNVNNNTANKGGNWALPTVIAIAGVVLIVMIGVVMSSMNQASQATARAQQAEQERQQAELERQQAQQALEEKENQGLGRDILDGLDDIFDENWW